MPNGTYFLVKCIIKQVCTNYRLAVINLDCSREYAPLYSDVSQEMFMKNRNVESKIGKFPKMRDNVILSWSVLSLEKSRWKCCLSVFILVILFFRGRSLQITSYLQPILLHFSHNRTSCDTAYSILTSPPWSLGHSFVISICVNTVFSSFWIAKPFVYSRFFAPEYKQQHYYTIIISLPLTLKNSKIVHTLKIKYDTKYKLIPGNQELNEKNYGRLTLCNHTELIVCRPRNWC